MLVYEILRAREGDARGDEGFIGIELGLALGQRRGDGYE